MKAQFRALGTDVDRAHVGDELHGVRHAGVDVVDHGGAGLERQCLAEAQVLREGHGDRDLAVAHERRHRAGIRHESQLCWRADAVREREGREAARAVAAHFGAGAVGVEVDHAGVGSGRIIRSLEQEHAVGTDAEAPVAKGRDLFGRERDRAGTIVDHDEIVSGAVHLGELDPHGEGRGTMGR